MGTNQDDSVTSKKSGWRQPGWQLIIAAAVITGAASIAPKLYEVVTEPTAGLAYSITTGPEMPGADGARQIVAVTVTNTGKRMLTKVVGSLISKNGKIEAAQVSASDLMPLQEKTESNSVSIQAESMMPSDQLTISALFRASDGNPLPTFAVRSSEVVGALATKDKSRSTFTELLTLASATGILGAGLLSLIVSVFIRRRRIEFTSISPDDFRSDLQYKDTLLLHLGVQFGVKPVQELALRGRSSFADAATLILQEASEKPNRKPQMLLALEAIAQFSMAEISRAIVEANYMEISEASLPDRFAQFGKTTLGAKDLHQLISEIAQRG